MYNNIYNTLQERYESNLDQGNFAIITILFGSQNYHMADELSDIDTYTLRISTTADYVMSPRKTSRGIRTEQDNGDDVSYDLFHFMNQLKSGSLTALELLNSPYTFGTGSYYKNCKKIFRALIPVVWYFNQNKFIETAAELGLTFCDRYLITMKTEKARNKALSQALRYKQFIYDSHVLGYSFVPTNAKELLSIKRQEDLVKYDVGPLKEMFSNCVIANKPASDYWEATWYNWIDVVIDHLVNYLLIDPDEQIIEQLLAYINDFHKEI